MVLAMQRRLLENPLICLAHSCHVVLTSVIYCDCLDSCCSCSNKKLAILQEDQIQTQPGASHMATTIRLVKSLSYPHLQGVPKKLRLLCYSISPSVLRLQFYALHGQWKDVLTFVLHIGTDLSDKRFLRYSGSGYDSQILCKTILKVYIYWRIYRYMRFLN